MIGPPEQHVAHHHDPNEALAFIDDPQISNKRAAGEVAQGLHRLFDRRAGAEDCERRVHHSADRVLRICFVPGPLATCFRFRGRKYLLSTVSRHFLQDILCYRRVEKYQNACSGTRRMRSEDLRGFSRVRLEDRRSEHNGIFQLCGLVRGFSRSG